MLSSVLKTAAQAQAWKKKKKKQLYGKRDEIRNKALRKVFGETNKNYITSLLD